MFTHRKAISGSINFFLFLWSLPCLPQFSWNGGFSNRHFKFSFRDGSRQNAITDGSGESPGHVEIQGFPGSSKGCQKSVDVLLWLVNYVWHVLVDNQCLLTHGNGGSGLAFQISTFLLHVNSSASWSMGSPFFYWLMREGSSKWLQLGFIQFTIPMWKQSFQLVPWQQPLQWEPVPWSQSNAHFWKSWAGMKIIHKNKKYGVLRCVGTTWPQHDFVILCGVCESLRSR